MSKSLGNFVTLKDAFKKFDPLVVRFFILQSHYRSTLDFSDEALAGTKVGLEKLQNTIRNLRAELRKAESEARTSGESFDVQPFRQRFLDAMNDDFNAPMGVAVLFDLSKEVNQALNSEKKLSLDSLQTIEALFTELGGSILGIIIDKQETTTADAETESGLLDLFLAVRTEVRKQKLWTLSDVIRDGLKKFGFVVEDKKDGTTWRKTS
jgi:cysteinyl-tRNA synthetase